MDDIMSSVSTTTKSMFSGNKKWLWIGGVVVVVLLVFFFNRRRGSGAGSLASYPQAPQAGSGGSSTSDLAALQDIFTRAMDNQGTQFMDMLSSQQNLFQNQIDDIREQSSQSLEAQQSIFAQMLNNLTDTFTTQLRESEQRYDTALDQLRGTLINNSNYTQQPISSIGSGIIYDIPKASEPRNKNDGFMLNTKTGAWVQQADGKFKWDVNAPIRSA